MKYDNLLTLVKRLSQQQVKAERAHSASGLTHGLTPARRARLHDKATAECFERDKLLDLVHCELVNVGLCEPHPVEEYEPREISQGAGLGHSIKFLYEPPKPDCIK